ncbi:hypothetical protein [Francisella sp. LA112445]|uniref:hypothetical protein n=1 Tax=Francisella sp. LA112445 TaxID=1395624 RepID=UPI001788AD00|nr:hypothetical protein [Francisella sp. LA112445]QIW09995.1 hypothetical protein FIP56_04570 [Francisella sp. LA112445]
MIKKIVNFYTIVICLSIIVIGCNATFTLPNYQLTGTYYNPDYSDYSKDDLINRYFHENVEQMETSPYTYQGQYYEETGYTQPSPFMQNINFNNMYE